MANSLVSKELEKHGRAEGNPIHRLPQQHNKIQTRHRIKSSNSSSSSSIFNSNQHPQFGFVRLRSEISSISPSLYHSDSCVLLLSCIQVTDFDYKKIID